MEEVLFFNATLVERQDLTPELAIVKVRPDSGEVPVFEPGQYILLGLPRDPQPPAALPEELAAALAAPPKLVRRAYSIASPPQCRDSLEFYVVLVRGGKLTPKLWPLHQGDRLWIDHKASGSFTLAGVPRQADLVFFATGTGLGPYLSMLRCNWIERDGQPRWRRLAVVHGVRCQADLGYRAQIQAICQADPSVVYVPVLSREPADSGYQGPRGHVQGLLDGDAFLERCGFALDPAACHVFLCGNPQMIEAMELLLLARGFILQTREAPGTLHRERFW